MTLDSNHFVPVHDVFLELTTAIENCDTGTFELYVLELTQGISLAIRKERLENLSPGVFSALPAKKAIFCLRGCISKNTSINQLWAEAAYRGALNWIIPALGGDKLWRQEIVYAPLTEMKIPVNQTSELVLQIKNDLEKLPHTNDVTQGESEPTKQIAGNIIDKGLRDDEILLELFRRFSISQRRGKSLGNLNDYEIDLLDNFVKWGHTVIEDHSVHYLNKEPILANPKHPVDLAAIANFSSEIYRIFKWVSRLSNRSEILFKSFLSSFFYWRPKNSRSGWVYVLVDTRTALFGKLRLGDLRREYGEPPV